jgi:outer membrane protein TolC
LQDLTRRALALRPEITELSATAQGLRERADGVQAARKPQFTVQGGVDYIENRHFQDQAYSSLMLMGEWNLFDSGKKRHNTAQLEQQAEALLRKRADLESVIRLQVLDAWRNLETTRQRLEVNREALRSADENLRVAKRRYEQGAGTNTEVLDAETLRTRTYSHYYESLYNTVQALMQLNRAVGDFGFTAAAGAPGDAAVPEEAPPATGPAN